MGISGKRGMSLIVLAYSYAWFCLRLSAKVGVSSIDQALTRVLNGIFTEAMRHNVWRTKGRGRNGSALA